METGKFTITAKSEKMTIHMAVEVKSTEACMNGTIAKAQNVLWDALRDQDFDANKILIMESEK